MYGSRYGYRFGVSSSSSNPNFIDSTLMWANLRWEEKKKTKMKMKRKKWPRRRRNRNRRSYCVLTFLEIVLNVQYVSKKWRRWQLSFVVTPFVQIVVSPTILLYSFALFDYLFFIFFLMDLHTYTYAGIFIYRCIIWYIHIYIYIMSVCMHVCIPHNRI